MEFLSRTWLPAIALVTTIGLGACDSNTEVSNKLELAEASTATPVATESAAEAIAVTQARIRATAPGQTVGGAFMTLTNASATPRALTAVTANIAGVVEIHETSMQGEMMRMRQVSQIDIPANGSVELKPGSYHIMLMGLEEALAAGTTETLTLAFSDKSHKTVEASVVDSSE